MNGNNFKQTEIGLIPEDWEVMKLGDVADYINGYAFKPSEWKHEGKPIIRIQNLNDKSKPYNFYNGALPDKYLVKEGDLLISWSASLGAFLWDGGDAWLNQHIFKVVPQEEVIDKTLLYFIVNYFISTLKEKTRGTTMKHIVKKEFLNSSIPLPLLTEQQKISNVLSKIQKAIEKQDNIIEAAKNLKKSLMQKLFTEGLYGEEQKETELGFIPESWEVVRLGEMAEIKYGKANPKTKGNFPVIGSSGIYAWADKPLIKYPTIVVGRKGTAGEVHLLESPCYPSDTTFYLKWKNINSINVKYIFYFLKEHKLSGEHAKTTLPSLQRHDLEKQKIPLPPLSKQKEIAYILSTIDKKIEAEEKRKTTLKELFKTMLHKLMTGEIRLKDVKV